MSKLTQHANKVLRWDASLRTPHAGVKTKGKEMKIISSLVFMMFFLSTACNAQNISMNPKDVYLAFLEEYQSIENLVDKRIDKFLSKKAIDRKNKKSEEYKKSNYTKEQLDMFVVMAKKSRALPDNPQIEFIEKENTASLTITAKTDEGLLTATIDMVDESGWKIEKDVWVITWGENGYFTSELWGN